MIAEQGETQFGARVVTDDVITAAQAFLSPAQVQGLQTLMTQERQAAQLRTLRQQYQNASGSPVPLRAN